MTALNISIAKPDPDPSGSMGFRLWVQMVKEVAQEIESSGKEIYAIQTELVDGMSAIEATIHFIEDLKPTTIFVMDDGVLWLKEG